MTTRRLATLAVALAGCVGLQDFGTRAEPGDRGLFEGGDADSSTDDAGHDVDDDDARVEPRGDSEDADVPEGTTVLIPGGPMMIVWPHGGTTMTHLTHDFYVDRHEVTVGQFRAWVDAGMPAPCPGQTCSLEPGGPYQDTMRWSEENDKNVRSPGYKEGTGCSKANGQDLSKVRTYPLGDASLPMNCVTFAQALAVCHFRGMRLLTEVEWYWLASGRGQQRTYPWGNTVPSSCDQSILDLDGKGCSFPRPVMSAIGDVTRDGVLDFGGSLSELTWGADVNDVHKSVLPDDYVGENPRLFYRDTRGGNYLISAEEAVVNRITPSGVTATTIGFRCAKTKL